MAKLPTPSSKKEVFEQFVEAHGFEATLFDGLNFTKKAHKEEAVARLRAAVAAGPSPPGVPEDLMGYGEKRLERFPVAALRDMCAARVDRCTRGGRECRGSAAERAHDVASARIPN